MRRPFSAARLHRPRATGRDAERGHAIGERPRHLGQREILSRDLDVDRLRQPAVHHQRGVAQTS
ncbi:MAG: hypothetical protein ABIY55_35300 [Kofleriaceae bacterium]